MRQRTDHGHSDPHQNSLLKPEAELHVVAEELGPDLLVGVEHDARMVAALEPAAICGERVTS